MYDPDGDDGRIDDGHREASPSTGFLETAVLCHATAGVAHAPAEDVLEVNL